MEGINDTLAQRHLRTDKRQIDAFYRGEPCEPVKVIRVNGNKFCLLANPAIARRGIYFANLGTLCQCVDDSVLSPSGTDDEDFHFDGVICVRIALSAPVR